MVLNSRFKLIIKSPNIRILCYFTLYSFVIEILLSQSQIHIRLKFPPFYSTFPSVSVLSELRHHRHWQKALENITGCHFTMLPSMLPTEGMILGGNLTLHGQNLSLACFHGINFRSKAWAIFTLNDVYISFSTEAQKTQDQGMSIS